MKNKLTKQTVKPDKTAHKEPSHLDLHFLQMCVRIYLMPEFTRIYPNDIHVATKENETIVSLEVGTEHVCGTGRVCRAKAKSKGYSC